MKILSSLRVMLDWVVSRFDACFSWITQRLDFLFGEITSVVDSLIRVGIRAVILLILLQIFNLDLVAALKEFLS